MWVRQRTQRFSAHHPGNDCHKESFVAEISPSWKRLAQLSIWGKWRHPVWMVVIDTQGRHTLELSQKDFLNWCNSSLLKEGRSQLGWYLNAKARKYLNTTGEDPTKIGRWRDSLRRRTWKGKFVEAWKTCLHPLYLHPVTANQSQSERSRKGKGVLRKRLQWKQRIRDRKKRKYKLGAHLTCKRGVNGELWQELWLPAQFVARNALAPPKLQSRGGVFSKYLQTQQTHFKRQP